jgi:hypothetical protein
MAAKANYIKVLDEPDKISEEIYKLCNNINRIYGLVVTLKGLIAPKKENDFWLIFCRYFGKMPDGSNSWRSEFLGLVDKEGNFQPWYSSLRREFGESLPCNRPLTELIILVLALQFLLPFYDLFWDWKFHKVEESENEAAVEVKFIRGSDDKEIVIRLTFGRADEIAETLKRLVASAE